MALPPRSPPLPWHPEAGAPPPRLCLAGIAAARWVDHPQNPLLGSRGPPLAEPTFLPPGQTPDERWHLFGRSGRGIVHRVSDDGVSWSGREEPVVPEGQEPCLVQEGGRYHLLYAVSTRDLPWRTAVTHLEIRSSVDLQRWSAPRTLLRPCLSWHREGGESLGSPRLLRVGGRLRLYFGAGRVRLEDQGRDVSRSIGVAESESLDGPFTCAREPLLGPDPNDPLARLAAGTLSVLPVEDGLIGFQCPLTQDHEGRTQASVRALGSADGLQFRPLGGAPALRGGDQGRPGCLFSADVRAVGGVLRMYYSGGARRRWRGEVGTVHLAIGI